MTDDLIYACVVGSRAYGLAGPDSDTDRRGVFLAPAEAFWRMKIDVDDLMTRSFPAPEHVAIIRQMFEDSVADDAMGLDIRREKGRLRFDYSNVVLTAER